MRPTTTFFNTEWSYWDYFKIYYWKTRKAAIQFTKQYQITDDIAIEVQDLNAYFSDFHGNKLQVLKNINFTFLKNHTYCIIGNSGSGKTTLANHFNGLIKSPYGNIYLQNNKKIMFFKRKIRNYKAIRRNISSVMQNPENQLFKESVLKDVTFGPKILGFPKDQILPTSVKALLDFGIDENLFNSNPFNLSGGQKRKVALAGIFAINPEIIVFDEPTVGLDPFSEKKTISIIKNLKQEKKTVIVITHNMNHVLEIADHVILLNKGQIIYDAPTFEFFRNHEILNQLNISVPQIINIIEKLCKLDHAFNALWTIKPREVNDLAKAITEIYKKEN